MVETANTTVNGLKSLNVRSGFRREGDAHTRDWVVPSFKPRGDMVPLYALADLVPPRGPRFVGHIIFGRSGLDTFPVFYPLGAPA